MWVKTPQFSAAINLSCRCQLTERQIARMSKGMNQGAALTMAALILASGMRTAVGLPDLVVNRPLLKQSVQVERRAFTADGCAYQEGCLRGLGNRKLLLVDAGIANIGDTDLEIGNPEGRPELFQYSGCHNHYHIANLVKYRLLDLRGRPVVQAKKQGFCLRDNYPYLAGTTNVAKYDCVQQGITAGWQDVYDKGLECQWMDISGVRPGKYYLEVTVNPRRVFPESDYLNNKVMVLITVPRI